MMYEEQIKYDWPGLAKEVSELCKLIHVEDANVTEKGKKEYAVMVKKACMEYDEKAMKDDMATMKDKKMKQMVNENCKLKDYVKSGTLFSVRKMWEVWSYMLRVAGNYPKHRKYERTSWLCQACDLRVREDQDHLPLCQGYADLRDHTDLGNDVELVDFFREVMARREKEG